ncbi:VCBS repeat-containing protein [Crocinitomix algicola]|uniref:VCBS repeat-containing protein n=1 Tax=Crocinitomix algicola TaxID=1740263 RepID=UPI0009F43CAC|nr:VCBS repeat-containing protein [Crocinitomix algicola]
MKYIFYGLILTIGFSCSNKAKDKDENLNTPQSKTVGFKLLSPEESGVTFTNTFQETEELNYYNFEYIYNGGGVAIGDINNDQLADLYFTGNATSDKLYLNKGNLKFEDITATAFDYDLASHWHTGVTMVDINSDGFLDIYVCRSGGNVERENLKNLLFVNNGDNTFTEKGEEYGVAIDKRTTSATFFDYDNDGDLDLYVLNHPDYLGSKVYTNEEVLKMKRQGPDMDVLLENQEGKFVDVTEKAGIKAHMFGLGVAISDLNQDGFQDIYVSNDYIDPDLLYINNGDGTFTDQIIDQMKHVSNFSMGNDVADFNNDGLIDIMTLDMASEDHIRSKRNMGAMNTDKFWNIVGIGYHLQYMFNSLQLNNGNGTFSDVGQMAGVAKTDWSWAPLFADFDNDGKKDLFVTNGYKRDMRDNDYNAEYNYKKETGELESFQEGLDLVPTAKIKNYLFHNQGDLKFEKVHENWGLDMPLNSNGAAYADLDNDGDLDLVLNNMDDQASIFENLLNGPASNFLRIQIKGYAENQQGIGTKVTLYTKDELQHQELHTARGYISSVEPFLHFGLGENDQIDRIEVEWLDGTTLVKENLQSNQTIIVDHANGHKKKINRNQKEPFFTDISDSLFSFEHQEVLFNDFESEILLPHKMSQLGPFITKGDVNGDQKEDIYISGSHGSSGQLFIQTKDGFKIKKGPWEKEKLREEMEALFIDVDGDNDLDLYVVSGGNEAFRTSKDLQDQLYINDGKGNFKNESDKRLPEMIVSGQSIAAGDIDNDGDLDLYLGGRQIPGYYPFIPKSYLLENEGGYFKDITAKSPNVASPGLITDAIFDDFDADGDQDLIVVGEWLPVVFFENEKGILSDVTNQYNKSLDVGWYYSIEKGDFNQDGRSDYIIGNLGENNKFHPSKNHPLEIYCHDFDENGTKDIVLAKHQDDICYPVRGRQCSSEQMPFIKQKFRTYADFATASIETIYGRDQLNQALHFQATNFSSVIFLSNEAGFEVKALPAYSQMGPINKTLVDDFNGDGFTDALIVGNNYSVEVETMRYDGGRGCLLLGDGTGKLKALSPKESGFFENNDTKDMEIVNFNGKDIVITVSNLARAKTFMCTAKRN